MFVITCRGQRTRKMADIRVIKNINLFKDLHHPVHIKHSDSFIEPFP